MLMIVVATFVLCAAVILGTYWTFVVRPETKAARALQQRLKGKPAARPSRHELTKKDAPLSALKALDSAIARSGRLVDPLQQLIAQSGLSVSIGVVLLTFCFVATITFMLLNLLISSAWLAGVGALLAASVPYMYLRRLSTIRIRKMEEQLPQVVDMIAVSLRAGHAFTTGLLMVAEEVEKPLGSEFRLLYDQQNYGKPLADVLKEFADRVPLLDARIFVTAVLTQRETGGNLAEMLDKLAAVIRERFRVRRQVRAVSAHGRMTGWVLGLMAPVLAVALFLIAPEHMMTLVDDPLGRQLVAGAVFLEISGALIIRRIVNVEV